MKAILARIAEAATIAGFIFTILYARFSKSFAPVSLVTIAAFAAVLLLSHHWKGERPTAPDKEGTRNRRNSVIFRAIVASILLSISALVFFNTRLDAPLPGNSETSPTQSIPKTASIAVTPTLPVEAGRVAGVATPPAPTIKITGSGCEGSSTRVSIRTPEGRAFSVRVALDDAGDTTRHVRASLHVDGTLMDTKVLTPGSGAFFQQATTVDGASTLTFTSLTHSTTRCRPNEVVLHLLDLTAA